jgi:Tol biopolymer transport system component
VTKMTDTRDLGQAAFAAAGLLLATTAPAWAGTTERVSVGLHGVQADGVTNHAVISADGRFVVFDSDARNLASGDPYGYSDVFVRDRRANITKRVSLRPDRATSAAPVISADGRFVAFTSYDLRCKRNCFGDLFLRDRKLGRTELVSVALGDARANGDSIGRAISADGRFVAFDSVAANLVPSDTNGTADVFVRDRETGRTELVSVGPDSAPAGGGGASLSADGRFVAFSSVATDLVAGDTNGVPDIFIRDRVKGTTERVSVSSNGEQADGYNGGYPPAISADGRFVTFDSGATNLVPGDTNASFDVFVRDRKLGRTERISTSSGGAQGDDSSFSPALSAGGRFVAFVSRASNLVPGDTNGGACSEPPCVDLFVRDRKLGTIKRVSVSSKGEQANEQSFNPSISAGGRLVAFVSDASNLVPNDTNGLRDAFVRTR